MAYGVAKAVSLFIIFNVLIYFVHSSIRSLEDIDLLTDGDYIKLSKNKEARYRKALKESQWELNNYNSVPIKKCCKSSHVFDESLKCIPKKDSDEDEFNFFASRMVIDKHLLSVSSSNITIHIDELDADNQCRDQVIWLKDYHTFNYFIMIDTGSLVNVDNVKVVNYSTHYCLEVVHENYLRYAALMICPCQENLCIQKCCPLGEYFSTRTNKCKMNIPSTQDWQLHFHDQNRKLNYSVNHFLIHRPLNCSNNPDDIINTVDATKDALIQEDGSLLHDKTNQNIKIFTNHSDYCVDMFSDASGMSQTNGFFCKKKLQKRQIVKSSAPFSKCCTKGMSLNKRFKCQAIPENETDSFIFPPAYNVATVPNLVYKNFNVPDNELSVKLKMNEYVEKTHRRERKRIDVKDIVENYDRSMFCIDAYQGNESNFGVIFLPCEKNLCIQKCCPPGYYYDLSLYGCVKSSRFSKLLIDVSTFSGFKVVHREPQFFLIYDHSRCQSFERQLYANSVGYHKIHAQVNGDVVKQKEQYKSYVWVPTLWYCLDIFSDGSVALANGFYCTDQKKKARQIFLDKEDIYDPFMRGMPDTDNHFGTATKHSPYQMILIFCFILYYRIVN